MKIYLTKLGELSLYPPALSLIRILQVQGNQVVYIGAYSDKQQKSELEKNGIRFIDTVNYLPEDGSIKKLRGLFSYANQVKNALKNDGAVSSDVLWIFNADTMCLLSGLIPQYKTVLHFFEFVEATFNWKYKLVNPKYNFKKSIQAAKAIVHCEYNRAHITKGLYQLEVLPYIIPNKPYLKEGSFDNAPESVSQLVEELKTKTSGKRVILYQGYFNSKQRRLEEFCEAVRQMSDDYSLIIMGRGNESFNLLKEKYNSGKIIFVPFVNPPYHLLITQLARIGVLSYFPTGKNYAEVLNPIYCAPNKVFEYGMFGIPMISNDIPGLQGIYDKYNCGVSIPYPMTVSGIMDAIEIVFRNYDDMSRGAKIFNDSTDVPEIVKSIVNSLESR